MLFPPKQNPKICNLKSVRPCFASILPNHKLSAVSNSLKGEYRQCMYVRLTDLSLALGSKQDNIPHSSPRSYAVLQEILHLLVIRTRVQNMTTKTSGDISLPKQKPQSTHQNSIQFDVH